jgi:transcriptional regulator with XRE-family HTH domain
LLYHSNVVHPGRKRREDSPYTVQAQRLAARVRSLREVADLTQEQLAARARVPLATLRTIEGGRVANPGHFTVMAVLGALGAQAEELAT